MLIAVDMGHCPKSTGAVGYLDELKEDRLIGNALIKELKARGHSVVNVTPGDSESESLTGRANRANRAGAQFFVSIHLNWGGGKGTEVFTTSTSGAKAEAAKCSAALSSLMGIPNRGHKYSNFTVLTKTNMPAMLVETCFVDTFSDVEAYRAVTSEQIAATIAASIVGGSGAAASQPTQSQPTSSEEKLDEDGYWGPKVTYALQAYFGTPYDGIISGQHRSDFNRINDGGLSTDTWEVNNGKGSKVIKKLQEKIGTKADGYFGKKSCYALQAYLGTKYDGMVSGPSKMVKAMQVRINNKTL